MAKWRRECVERRLEGLDDEPRVGAPRTILDAQLEALIVTTLKTTPPGEARWSTRSMAKAVGISHYLVGRIWRTFRLQPLDYNKNGRIDVPYELIGGTLGPPNAFDFLSAVDGIISRGRPGRVANRRPDGYIDSSDAIYSDLVLWVDSNGNGVSEEDELRGLQHARVTRLSVAREQREGNGHGGSELGLQLCGPAPTVTLTVSDGSVQ